MDKAVAAAEARRVLLSDLGVDVGRAIGSSGSLAARCCAAPRGLRLHRPRERSLGSCRLRPRRAMRGEDPDSHAPSGPSAVKAQAPTRSWRSLLRARGASSHSLSSRYIFHLCLGVERTRRDWRCRRTLPGPRGRQRYVQITGAAMHQYETIAGSQPPIRRRGQYSWT